MLFHSILLLCHTLAYLFKSQCSLCEHIKKNSMNEFFSLLVPLVLYYCSHRVLFFIVNERFTNDDDYRHHKYVRKIEVFSKAEANFILKEMRLVVKFDCVQLIQILIGKVFIFNIEILKILLKDLKLI